jgi:photosystem II stability/assembly factor-like uncharacterized protein
VGAGGTILRTWNGGDFWLPQLAGTEADLHAVDAVHGGTAWAVGGGGTILKTVDGGNTWLSQPSGAGGTLYDVFAVDGGKVWAVGSGGMILKTGNGSAWAPQPSGTGVELRSVSAADGSSAWAVGAGGTILRTADGGATWAPQPSGTTVDLLAVCAVDAYTAWAAGRGGLVLLTRDGGANWFPISSGTTASLYGLSVYADTAWVVGDGGYRAKIKDKGYVPAPAVSSLSPTSGREGDLVVIEGSGFGNNQGESYAAFGISRVTDYLSWSDTRIEVKVPSGVSGGLMVTVVTLVGVSNGLAFEVEVMGSGAGESVVAAGEDKTPDEAKQEKQDTDNNPPDAAEGKVVEPEEEGVDPKERVP